eukprot:1744260-Rhodomonas_salina.1
MEHRRIPGTRVPGYKQTAWVPGYGYPGSRAPGFPGVPGTSGSIPESNSYTLNSTSAASTKCQRIHRSTRRQPNGVHRLSL